MNEENALPAVSPMPVENRAVCIPLRSRMETVLDRSQSSHPTIAETASTPLQYPDTTAYRTSNMVDRHMLPLDRWLFASRHFHGHWRSAELYIRTWVLFHDFMPYCPRAKIRKRAFLPAHQLNGFVYHQNWLHNLLISTSCAGLLTNHRKS